MASSVIDGDLYVRGVLRTNSYAVPAGSVGNTQIGSGDPIAAEKMVHQYVAKYSQARGSASVADRRVIHVAHGDGDIVSVAGGITTACTGNATVTIDLLKNGTTVLSGTVQIDSGDAAYASVAGTIANTTYEAGDVFEANTTVAAGNGTVGQGAWVSLVLREDAD